MSRNNASRSYQIQALVKQVQEASEDELWTLHWIEIEDDGSVYDNCYGKLFDDVHAWATFNIDMEALEDDGPGFYGELDE